MIVYNHDGTHGSDFISEASEIIFNPGISQLGFAYIEDNIEKELTKDLHRGRSTTRSTGEDNE